MYTEQWTDKLTVHTNLPVDFYFISRTGQSASFPASLIWDHVVISKRRCHKIRQQN